MKFGHQVSDCDTLVTVIYCITLYMYFLTDIAVIQLSAGALSGGTVNNRMGGFNDTVTSGF